jgi:hypothetical protein
MIKIKHFEKAGEKIMPPLTFMTTFPIFFSAGAILKYQEACRPLINMPSTYFAEEMDLKGLTRSKKKKLIQVNRRFYLIALEIIRDSYKSKSGNYLKQLAKGHNLTLTSVKAKIRTQNNKKTFKLKII